MVYYRFQACVLPTNYPALRFFIEKRGFLQNALLTVSELDSLAGSRGREKAYKKR